jgi:hypothetical protein
MIQLKLGVWESKSGIYSGNVKILGKEFIVFVNENEKKTGNQPDLLITVQESNKNESK